MIFSAMHRRDVLKGLVTGAGALAGAAGPTLAQTVRVRRNIATAPAALITAFRTGVARMQALPASNPRSWQYWANVHGGPNNTPGTWNQCQHGSFFFLPWHRMYLFYLEKVLRSFSGDPNFALPYWNWTANRVMPPPFRSPANATSNRLFVASPNRSGGINAGVPLPSTNVSFSTAFSFTNFSSASGGLNFGGRTVGGPVHFGSPHGQLESSPHDIIHVDIGGSNGWMSDPFTAARDPVFYVHHCNIDRLWKRWLALGGGRANPTGNATWMNQTFRFFNHDTNAVVNVRVRDFLDTAGQLQYRYDDDPAAAPVVASGDSAMAASGATGGGPGSEMTAESGAASPAPESLASSPEGIRLGDDRVQVPLAARPEAAERLRRPAPMAAAPDAAGSGRIILRLSGIDFDRNPGASYQVYLNLPEGEDPDPHSVYYAGVLGFFGLKSSQHDSHAQTGAPGGERVFDITDLVARQNAAGVWKGDDPTVTLVVSGVPEKVGERVRINPRANARIGKVEILRQ
jgi:Common central domain of tyrosinase/Polyphenol oxidase middle domain